MRKSKIRLFNALTASVLLLSISAFSISAYAKDNSDAESVSTEEYQFSGSKNCGIS